MGTKSSKEASQQASFVNSTVVVNNDSSSSNNSGRPKTRVQQQLQEAREQYYCKERSSFSTVSTTTISTPTTTNTKKRKSINNNIGGDRKTNANPSHPSVTGGGGSSSAVRLRKPKSVVQRSISFSTPSSSERQQYPRRDSRNNSFRFGPSSPSAAIGSVTQPSPMKTSRTRSSLASASQLDVPPPPPPLSPPKRKLTAQPSFHEALVRERDDRYYNFNEIYEVLDEIGQGGLCKIYRIRKRDQYIGGSSRPELVRGGRSRFGYRNNRKNRFTKPYYNYIRRNVIGCGFGGALDGGTSSYCQNGTMNAVIDSAMGNGGGGGGDGSVVAPGVTKSPTRKTNKKLGSVAVEARQSNHEQLQEKRRPHADLLNEDDNNHEETYLVRLRSYSDEERNGNKSNKKETSTKDGVPPPPIPAREPLSASSSSSMPRVRSSPSFFEQQHQDVDERGGIEHAVTTSSSSSEEDEETATVRSVECSEDGGSVRLNNGSRSLLYALKVINLKLVKAGKIDQLKNEVEILKTLDHQNIIKAYETFQLDSITTAKTKTFGHSKKSNASDPAAANKLMIIMELCTGGDLYSRLPYRETSAIRVVRQILSAVAYMHDRNIIHRDIKFTNIMFESSTPHAAIKVIDFGLSKAYDATSNILTERVGTLHSMSPETIRGIYTSKADLWSIGVVTYMLLNNGIQPFDGDTPKEIVTQILSGTYEYKPANVWDKISPQGKDFISKLLVVEPQRRMTARQALNHEWLSMSSASLQALRQRNSGRQLEKHEQRPELEGGAVAGTGDCSTSIPLRPNGYDDVHAGDMDLGLSIDDEQQEQYPLHSPCYFDETSMASFSVDDDFLQRVRESIIRYSTISDFQKLALNVIAKKSSSEHICRLRKVFESWDTLQTGTLTLQELRDAMLCSTATTKDPSSTTGSCYTPEEVDRVFRNLDVNRNNVINYTEFLAAALETVGTIEEYRLAEAFDQMDSDDSGYISRENLKQILGNQSHDEQYIDQLISEVDIKKDGRISYEEFLQVFAQTKAHTKHESKDRDRTTKSKTKRSTTSSPLQSTTTKHNHHHINHQKVSSQSSTTKQKNHVATNHQKGGNNESPGGKGFVSTLRRKVSSASNLVLLGGGGTGTGAGR